MVNNFIEDGMVDVASNIDASELLLKTRPLKTNIDTVSRDELRAGAHVNDACVLLLALREHPTRVADPELRVKRASDQTALVQEDDALIVSLLLLEIKILVPVGELGVVQLRHVK